MSIITREKPSLDQWLKEAKAEETAGSCGMYLVRGTGLSRRHRHGFFL